MSSKCRNTKFVPGVIMTEGVQEHIKRTSLDEHKTKLARIPLGHEGDPEMLPGLYTT